MSRGTDRTADLERTLAAIIDAGRAVARAFGTDQEVRHKSPTQPVTAADLEADRILRASLTAARPDYGWLSEESGSGGDRLDRSRVWVIDPIDGTRSFVAGYAEFGISVALVEAGEPIIGAVLNAATDELFWAVRGEGAYRATVRVGGVGDPDPSIDPSAVRSDGRRIAVSAALAARPILLASRSEIRRGELDPFPGGAWELRPLGSTAYKMATVAAGAGHGYLSRGEKSEWDVAGGALIVEEAGGRVTDLFGEPYRFNKREPYVVGVVAGTPAVHGRLLEHVAGLPSPRSR